MLVSYDIFHHRAGAAAGKTIDSGPFDSIGKEIERFVRAEVAQVIGDEGDRR